MKRIILSTESGADLPKDLVEKHQIQVVPMHVIMDGKDYLDGELSVEEVFDFYDRTKSIPSTAATNVHEYEELFTKVRLKFLKVSLFTLAIRQKHLLPFKVR